MAGGQLQMLERHHTETTAKARRQLGAAIEKLVLEAQISP